MSSEVIRLSGDGVTSSPAAIYRYEVFDAQDRLMGSVRTPDDLPNFLPWEYAVDSHDRSRKLPNLGGAK